MDAQRADEGPGKQHVGILAEDKGHALNESAEIRAGHGRRVSRAARKTQSGEGKKGTLRTQGGCPDTRKPGSTGEELCVSQRCPVGVVVVFTVRSRVQLYGP